MSCQNCAEEVAAAQKKRTAQLREHQAKLVAADNAKRGVEFPSQEEVVRAAQTNVKPDKAVEAPKKAPVQVEADPEPAQIVEPEPEVVEEEATVEVPDNAVEEPEDATDPVEPEVTPESEPADEGGDIEPEPTPEPEKPAAKAPRTKAKSADSF